MNRVAKVWVTRALKLAFVAPFSMFTAFVALRCSGMPVMAEPGHLEPLLFEQLGGLAMLATIAVLWVSILTDGGTRFSARARYTMVVVLALGAVFALQCILAGPLGVGDMPLAMAVPLLPMVLWECRRLVVRP